MISLFLIKLKECVNDFQLAYSDVRLQFLQAQAACVEEGANLVQLKNKQRFDDFEAIGPFRLFLLLVKTIVLS